MATNCSVCGEPVYNGVWDEDLGSFICSDCEFIRDHEMEYLYYDDWKKDYDEALEKRQHLIHGCERWT